MVAKSGRANLQAVDVTVMSPEDDLCQALQEPLAPVTPLLNLWRTYAHSVRIQFMLGDARHSYQDLLAVVDFSAGPDACR